MTGSGICILHPSVDMAMYRQRVVSEDLWYYLKVCIPEFVLNEMRLEANSPIGGTGTRLLLYGPIAQENPGKIWEIEKMCNNNDT